MSTAFRGVRGGTCFGDPLCPTCRNALIVRGNSLSQSEIFCMSKGAPNTRMTFLAHECSAYDDKRNASRWDMEQIAWVLTTDVKTKRIGFKSPAELQKANYPPSANGELP